MRTTSFLSGVIAGAGLAYLTDQVSGRRRRSLVVDKSRHLMRETRESIDRIARDFSHRLQGKAANARQMVGNQSADDAVINERVRAALGRVCSHPHAIHTDTRHGHVLLTGLVLYRESHKIADAIAKVRGVRSVENRLDTKESAEGVPSLQGGRIRLRRGIRPVDRTVTGLLGGALVGASLFGRAILPGVIGGALLVRTLSRRGHGVLEVEKTLNLRVPVAEAWALFSDFTTFPRFMQHVREVRQLGDRTWRWAAEGPGGTRYSWDASVTQLEPNRVIAWRSMPGGDLECSGRVRFEDVGDGTSRMRVELRYRPPAGTLGHLVASLFGKDAKHALDDDMLRFKSLAEQGKARGHGMQVTRDQLVH
jgi:uncharacterized membrane protein